jgi:hypothetical protein
MAQVLRVVGLALVPGGLLWLTMPRLGFAVSVLSTAVGTCVVLILNLLATLSVGNALGPLTLAAWVYVLGQLMPRLKRLRRAERSRFHPAPLYLLCLPVLAFGAHEKLTTFARLELTTPKTAVATWQVRPKTGWLSAALPT